MKKRLSIQHRLSSHTINHECSIDIDTAFVLQEGFSVRKTTRRKASPRKKTAAKKPVRKGVARKKVATKKAVRKVTRRTTRKAAPKRATKKVARKKTAKRAGGAKLWTAAEVKMLRTAYKNMATSEIAKKLRRSLSSVRSKAVALSLKKAAPKRKAVSGRRTTRKKAYRR